MVQAIRRHQVQAVVCWKLDRLGRNLRHLVLFLDDLHARGIAFVTLGEGIDTSTPAGRLVAGVLASIAEFERARVQERIHAGLARARAQGRKLGRPKQDAPVERLQAVHGLSVRAAARRLEVVPRQSSAGVAPLSRHPAPNFVPVIPLVSLDSFRLNSLPNRRLRRRAGACLLSRLSSSHCLRVSRLRSRGTVTRDALVTAFCERPYLVAHLGPA